jgi:tetratricopeptide (TPR) repeat protein
MGTSALNKVLRPNAAYTWRSTGWSQTGQHPVVNVSWHDAIAFCAWLQKKTGKTYRLPSEAEWEYSCRAGTATRFYSGDDNGTLAWVANIADRSLKAKWDFSDLKNEAWQRQLSDWFDSVSWDDGYPFTAPVGKFQSNAFGLYDMHGNVWQWCEDSYTLDGSKSGFRQDLPARGSGPLRVYRGGAFNEVPERCRAAWRGWVEPTDHYCALGFRVVCEVDGAGAVRHVPATPLNPALQPAPGKPEPNLNKLTREPLAKPPPTRAAVVAQARDYILLTQWDKAAAQYAKVDLLARPLVEEAYAYAALFLIRGDSAGYSRFCLDMIRRAAQTEGPFEAYVLARSCATARKSPADPAWMVQWANQAVASDRQPYYFHVLGLAQYRAGQYDRALQSFTKASVKDWAYWELNWFGLALVHSRLGHPNEARRCLDKGIRWLERGGSPGPGRPATMHPMDWLEAQLLRREVEQTLPGRRPPAAKVLDHPPKRWAHLDTRQATIVDGDLQIQGDKEILTRERYAGPIEIAVTAKTEKNNIRIHAYRNASVIFNWEVNRKELRVSRPPGDGKDVATAAVRPLSPSVWHRIVWRIAERGMEIWVDGRRIFWERRSYKLSVAAPVRVHACDSAVTVSSFKVSRIR